MTRTLLSVLTVVVILAARAILKAPLLPLRAARAALQRRSAAV